MTDLAPLLTATDLRRSVEGRLLFEGLSFSLAPGQRLMVVGPSGSGKSLLLRQLAGLDPLESGSITFRGTSQEAWALPAFRAGVMLLPQRAALGAGVTVQEVLAQPFNLKAHAGRTLDVPQARQLAQALGRGPEFLALDSVTLSGGEGQLVALLRALLLSPTVLLLDEATSALDPDTTARAEAVLSEWCATGVTA
ncbi:ATP-binding cassette domain-containing protein [Deinococcus sp.]|uniref:ABC transporter ATP-binding protein n=1 Tax=Deinococcus sp. TaxID=47478 RepID=UPI0025BDB09A|nr:ATP-binding cassette domain-containing protein [Deinococcus sp.]